jgi:hypothetical protein
MLKKQLKIIQMHYNMFTVCEGIDQGLRRPVLEYFKMFYADTAFMAIGLH